MADGSTVRKRSSTSFEMFKGRLVSSAQAFGSPKERRRLEEKIDFGTSVQEDIPHRVTFPKMVFIKSTVAVGVGKKVKSKKWAVTDTTSIVIYNSELETQEYLKRGLVILNKIETNNQENSLTCFFYTERELTLIFENAQEMKEWGITLDGILRNNFNRKLIDETTKSRMIEDLCLKNIRGGIAKCLCEEEEEWEYEGNSLVLHGNSEVSFKWDGFTLQGSTEGLVGKWDGSVVRVQKGDVVFEFIYVPAVREYLCTQKEEWSWKWTRHFLASKSGEGASWLMEGSFPEPIIMILQGFRYLGLANSSS